jgi:hypothetical protein
MQIPQNFGHFSSSPNCVSHEKDKNRYNGQNHAPLAPVFLQKVSNQASVFPLNQGVKKRFL